MTKARKNILIVICVLLCVAVVGVFAFAGSGKSISKGIYLEAGGLDMIVIDDSPIVMRTKNDGIFEKFTTDDYILIVHSGIEDSYPGGTGVDFAMKLNNSKSIGISADVIEQLSELGYKAD